MLLVYYNRKVDIHSSVTRFTPNNTHHNQTEFYKARVLNFIISNMYTKKKARWNVFFLDILL